MRVGSQGPESLVWTVAGRRDAVRTQADPGQKSNQRDALMEMRVAQIAGRAEEEEPDSLKHGHQDYMKLPPPEQGPT